LANKNTKRFLIFDVYQSLHCMPKKKRTIIPFIIISSLIVAALFFYTLHKPGTANEPLKAVPVNAFAFMRVNDFNALYEKTTVNSHIWTELKTIPGFERINSELRFLDSLYRTVPMAREILQATPSFVSAHVTGKDKVSLLHVLQLPSGYGENSVDEMVSGLVQNKGTNTSRKYEGTTLHEVSLHNKTGVNDFSWAVSGDILMISFSTLVLEDAIRQVNSEESLKTLKGFPEIYATAGKNVDANIFVNFSRLPPGLAAFLKPGYRGMSRPVSSFAGWAGMDINLLSDMLLMNGFVTPPDSASSLAMLFMHQSPQKITVDEVLPASVASFVTVSVADPGAYFASYRSYLQGIGKLTAYNNNLQALNEACQSDIPAMFTEMMDNEITLAYDSPEPDTDSSRIFILIRVKSQGLAESRMTDLLMKSAATATRPLSAYTTDYRLDNEISFKIHRLPIGNLLGSLFGSLFTGPGEQYYALLDNYIIFGPSAASLKSLIHNQVLNKTLENDAAYKEFKNNLSPKSNILYFTNLSKSQAVYAPFLKSEIGISWKKYEAVFQKVPVMGFQLFSNNNMLYCNFLVKYLSSYNQETHTVWESKLDTLAAGKPVFVVNFLTKQNEVFVQDQNHTIYLINQVGRILWKLKLPDPINSEVFQVDYFRNGKLQLLFSTRNYLYLIDRKGNFVEKYPVKLRSPATCGVSVFDYENSRDYRLFIACEDKRVYAYGKEGTLVTGWSFGQSESEVNQPVSHFRVGDKDFLVFGDRFRTYILDRKGSTRISTGTFFPHSVRNNYCLHLPHDGSGAGVVTTDTTGKAYFILFNGEVKTAELDHFSANHYFDYKDLTGDGEMEFIFLDGNKLSVYGSNKERLFSYTFNEPIDTRPVFYQFTSGDRKLGVVCRNENRIYLFNKDGSLYQGFPLQGNTPFSIGNFGDSLSRFNLVVGSRDNFLYNYRVK
jgi:hypothetical protein